MPSKWIDFAALKSQVPIRDVLEHYGFLDSLSDKGQGKLIGPCPIHGGKNRTSFSVSTEKNIFNCFGECGGGNVLDLVMKVEDVGIRDAGVLLCEWFELSFERGDTGTSATDAPATSPAAADVDAGEVINPSLENPLKTLQPKHAYITERGIMPGTVRSFGIGYCVRGLMKGRIAIPIHNEDGDLVAYAGRAVTEELAQEKGKYRLPNGFSKGHVVFNLNQAMQHGCDRGLVLVEGFFDCMKVHQAGFPNVVALMGSSITEAQEALLLAASDRLVLMFDGDEAGNEGLRRVYGRLRRRLFLKEVHLEDEEQPDSLDAARIRELLS